MDTTEARPLVSVVMPSFNQGAFVKAAVGSVLEQDYPSLELMIADGGSVDGTLQNLEGLLTASGSKLRWISEKDSGPANAINKALKLARGEIIGWLNSDDLYAPGAVSAAARYLAANPDILMVYGEGQHIDAQGASLGRYPTRPPSASVDAFQGGCFVCQPAVFLRREVFDAVGYLDESLGTAFDFELWLRIFQRFPQRIAHIERVQAFSRLHGESITGRLRRLVAVEGMRVLARHLGKAEPHWLLSYVEELCGRHPFGDTPADLKSHVMELIEEVKAYLDGGALKWLAGELARDMRLQTALPGVYASVYPDGWAPQVLALRIRRLPNGGSTVMLGCDHQWPVFSPLALKIRTSWGSESRARVEKLGPFDLAVELPVGPIGENVVVLIESESTFIPSEVEPGSRDTRRLAFKVVGLRRR